MIDAAKALTAKSSQKPTPLVVMDAQALTAKLKAAASVASMNLVDFIIILWSELVWFRFGQGVRRQKLVKGSIKI